VIFIMALLFWKEGDPFMFIWDFLADKVLGEILDWVYGKLVEFLGEFLTMMNGLGTELFDLVWVQGVVEFFRCFGWALYGWASWWRCTLPKQWWGCPETLRRR